MCVSTGAFGNTSRAASRQGLSQHAGCDTAQYSQNIGQTAGCSCGEQQGSHCHEMMVAHRLAQATAGIQAAEGIRTRRRVQQGAEGLRRGLRRGTKRAWESRRGLRRGIEAEALAGNQGGGVRWGQAENQGGGLGGGSSGGSGCEWRQGTRWRIEARRGLKPGLRRGIKAGAQTGNLGGGSRRGFPTGPGATL